MGNAKYINREHEWLVKRVSDTCNDAIDIFNNLLKDSVVNAENNQLNSEYAEEELWGIRSAKTTTAEDPFKTAKRYSKQECKQLEEEFNARFREKPSIKDDWAWMYISEYFTLVKQARKLIAKQEREKIENETAKSNANSMQYAFRKAISG
jgi:hypothetical protein